MSFSLNFRSVASRRSSSRFAPLGRDPLIGSVTTEPSVLSCKNLSGDADKTALPLPQLMYAAKGAGFLDRSIRYNSKAEIPAGREIQNRCVKFV